MKVPLDVQKEIVKENTYKGLLAIVRLAGESGGVNMHAFTGASCRGTAGLGCSIRSKKAPLHPFGLGKWLPKPDELGSRGKLKPDPYTPILDDFQKPVKVDVRKRTQPAVLVAGEGGLPSEGCRFVEGKYGKGVSLDMPKSTKGGKK